MKIRSVLSALLVATCLSAAISAVGAAADSRFIPVELWTGGGWNGSEGLRLPAVDVTFGRNDHKRIRGPIDWTRPGAGPRAGETLKVYERLNRGKSQLFALRRDGQGLGRVFDSRYDRNCIDAIKFPLGFWKQGEARQFSFPCGTKSRTMTLTILDLDFTHDGVDHSLRFRWVADGGTRRGTDNVYTFSPGLGMVEIEEN
jgi:hypothetical protein